MQSKTLHELFYFLATNHFRKALVRHTEVNAQPFKKLKKDSLPIISNFFSGFIWVSAETGEEKRGLSLFWYKLCIH